MIKLDGGYDEGGGSIVRVALALSTLTNQPFEVDNIRKGRCDSGLKHQHLFCVKALEELCNAKVEGAEVGSTRISYIPGTIKAKDLSIDIGTAGSGTLLMQSLLIPCLFTNKSTKIDISCGTDVQWSQPIDYFKEIFIPHIRKFCDKIDVRLIKRGYYPKGGGKIEINIKPKYKLNDFSNFSEFHRYLKDNVPKINLLEQGSLIQVKGVSHASLDLEKAEVAERQARVAEHFLKGLNCPIEIQHQYCDTLSTGSGICLWAIFSKNIEEIDMVNPIRIGADSLGERGKKAEIVGKEAAQKLIEQINYKAPVDEHLADNLVPYLALSGGRMKVAKITKHTTTNIYVVEKFLGDIVDKNLNLFSSY